MVSRGTWPCTTGFSALGVLVIDSLPLPSFTSQAQPLPNCVAPAEQAASYTCAAAFTQRPTELVSSLAETLLMCTSRWRREL